MIRGQGLGGLRKSAPPATWQPPSSGPGVRPGASIPAARPGSTRPSTRPSSARSSWTPPSSALRPSARTLADVGPVLGALSLAVRTGGKSLRPEIRLAVALFVAIALVGAGVGVAATHQGPAPHGSSTLAAASTGQASTADIGPIQLGGLPPISIPVPDLSGLASGLLGGLNPSPAPPAPAVGTPAAAPAAPATVPGIPATSMVADAAVNSVPIFGSAGGSSNMSVSGYNVEGQREAFLVLSSQPGWYQVEVPVRPNGTTGWIRASDVTTRSDPWYITVSQSQFKLNLYENGQLQNSFTVAVGVPATPTPNGSFFVWATQHWNQYPYAVGIFALSAFSPVLVNWPGGGRTGIHGWTDASVMGKRASNGCVRMTGNDFSVLMNNVPLGTPVVISD